MNSENLFSGEHQKKDNEINQKNSSMNFNECFKELNPNFKAVDNQTPNSFLMLMDNYKNMKRKQSRPTIITEKKGFNDEDGIQTNYYAGDMKDDIPQKKDRTPKNTLQAFSSLEKNKRFLANKVLMVRL